MIKYILILIGVLLLLCIFAIFNKLIRANNKVKEAFATMDVYLKKRWDLIPNLIETVKGYAKHENDTLKEVIELRNINYDDLSSNEKIKTNERVNRDLVKVFALSEDYPKLKANKNFMDLSDNLRIVEDEIAQSRKYFNAVVRDYNNLVEMFPSSIIAKLIGYKTKLMFSINSSERENIKVKL
ncbi:MAG: LemA family protein [Bacilli bacterium]|jgi:LemA protein|nr:LemA family protein [Bacilli bacterium]